MEKKQIYHFFSKHGVSCIITTVDKDDDDDDDDEVRDYLSSSSCHLYLPLEPAVYIFLQVFF